jgi:uncharacterized membrane protein
MGDFVLRGSLLKITEEAKIWCYFFPSVKVMCSVLPKMGWASFWAKFSQTHLVTLVCLSTVFGHLCDRDAILRWPLN